MKPYIGLINEGESRKSQGAKWENLTTLRDVLLLSLETLDTNSAPRLCYYLCWDAMLEVKNKSCFKFFSREARAFFLPLKVDEQKMMRVAWSCSEQLAQHTCSVLCVQSCGDCTRPTCAGWASAWVCITESYGRKSNQSEEVKSR